jgi:hypothetical protein
VHQDPHITETDARAAAELGEPGKRALRRIGSGGQGLVQADRARRVVEQHKIGEGAPDVEPDPITAR